MEVNVENFECNPFKCELRIRDIEKDIEDLKKDKVNRESIHELEKEIQKISISLNEVKNNRKEDREQIQKINESITRIEDMVNEYIRQMTEAIIGQEAIKELMIEYKSGFDEWKTAEQAKLINIFKRWGNKSRFNKFLYTSINVGAILMVITLIFSMYIDAINGNADTSTWDMFIEIIRAVNGN